MATPLVLDTCALVHAKAMSDLEYAPLELLKTLAQDHDYAYLTTNKVYGELLQSTLSTFFQELGSARPTLLTASRNEVKAVRNNLRRNMREPGDNDKELIALALRCKLPLLTHDAAAAALALRAGVRVWDLVDLAKHACMAGVVDEQTLHDAWGSLAGYPWPWPDYPWQGDLLSTFTHRYS